LQKLKPQPTKLNYFNAIQKQITLPVLEEAQVEYQCYVSAGDLITQCFEGEDTRELPLGWEEFGKDTLMYFGYAGVLQIIKEFLERESFPLPYSLSSQPYEFFLRLSEVEEACGGGYPAYILAQRIYDIIQDRLPTF